MQRKIPDSTVITADFKKIGGRENILYHVIISIDTDVMKIDYENYALGLLQEWKLKSAIDSAHFYYSVYDHHGKAIASTFPHNS